LQKNYLDSEAESAEHTSLAWTILLNADIFLRSFIRNYSMIMIILMEKNCKYDNQNPKRMEHLIFSSLVPLVSRLPVPHPPSLQSTLTYSSLPPPSLHFINLPQSLVLFSGSFLQVHCCGKCHARLYMWNA